MTEALSIRMALGDDTSAIVTGTKSMTGHLLGGAGALESLATLLALYHRTVPPTINLEDPEPGLGIDIASKVRELPAGDLAGINNSFGFGGHNVAIAFTNRYATAPDPSPRRAAAARSGQQRKLGRADALLRALTHSLHHPRGLPEECVSRVRGRQTTLWSQRTGAPSPA